jgi:hypothetical protein
MTRGYCFRKTAVILKKRVLLGLIVLLGMLFMAMPVTAEGVSLYIDGWEATTDVLPTLVNNRVMVPVRFIAEELGAEVQWQDPDIVIEKDDFKLQLTVNSKIAYKNGILMADMDTVPFLKENRTLVPLRFIAEALNVDVDYMDGKVLITTPSFKEKKAYYFDLALEMRFDFLPEVSPGGGINFNQFLEYACIRKNLQVDEMTKQYIDELAKNNFAIENVNHVSAGEWEFDGDRYIPAGTSYFSSCFFELVKENSFEENNKIMYEAVLDEYFFEEYAFYLMDFEPEFGVDYSEPLMYVLEKKGDEIRNGMSTIDAIKALIVGGDTTNFTKSKWGTLRLTYYIDEASGNIVFTHVVL